MNYLGQNDDGHHVFDLGDGGPPVAVAPEYLPEGGFAMPAPPPTPPAGAPLAEGGYSATPAAPAAPPALPAGAIGSNPDGSPMMPPSPSQAAPAPPKATFYTPPSAAPTTPVSTLQPPPVPSLTGGGGGLSGVARKIQNESDAAAQAQLYQGQQQAAEGLATQQLIERQNEERKLRQQAKDELIRQQADEDNKRLADYQAKVNEFASGKIDPNHAWASMDTGNKILAVIGTALGGLAQGFGIKDNAAAQMIQQHIQNDIRAQEANRDNDKFTLGQRKDLVSLAHQSGVDKLHQFDLATAAGDELAARQVEAMSAGFKGQDQQANAAVLSHQLRIAGQEKIAGIQAQQQAAANSGAELKLRDYELHFQRYQFQQQQAAQEQAQSLLRAATPGGGGGQGGPTSQGLSDEQANVARAQDPELYGKRLAHLGPNQNILVGSEDERKELEESISKAANAANAVRRLIDLRREHGGLSGGTAGDLSFNPYRKVAADAANDAKLALAGLAPYARLNPELLKLTGEAIPDHALAGDLTGSTDKGLQDLLGRLEGHPLDLMRTKGLRPDLRNQTGALTRGNGG